MAKQRHLTWETFSQNFLDPGRRAKHPIPGVPLIELFVDEGAKRIGLRAEAPRQERAISSDLEFIHVSQVMSGERAFFEVSTTRSQLYKIVFPFLLDISDLVQEEGLAPDRAYMFAIEHLRELLRSHSRLSREQEIGLFGEMWFVRYLIHLLGTSSTRSWLGGQSEPHDFRLKRIDVEVKTTLSTSRVHLIHGETQLQPAPGRALAVLSLQFAPAGASEGESLDQLIGAVQNELRDAPDELEHLKSGLRARNYELDSGYTECFIPRTEPRIVHVDQNCPRITRILIDQSMPTELAARVSDVAYRINLEGLGIPEGSRNFERAVKGMT